MDLFHDGKDLFVRGTFWEDMSKIKSASGLPGHEDVYGSCFEAFFGDNSKSGRYYLFRVDNVGNVADHVGYDSSWNRKASVMKVKKFSDRWVAVMKISLPEIGMDIIRNNELKAAFLRTRKTSDQGVSCEFSGWKFNMFHDPATFGTLTLQR
jgi:hypothetical protein